MKGLTLVERGTVTRRLCVFLYILLLSNIGDHIKLLLRSETSRCFQGYRFEKLHEGGDIGQYL